MAQVLPPSVVYMTPPQCPEFSTLTPGPISLLVEGPQPARARPGVTGEACRALIEAQVTGCPSVTGSHAGPAPALAAAGLSSVRQTPPFTVAASQPGAPPGCSTLTTCWTAEAEDISVGSPCCT